MKRHISRIGRGRSKKKTSLPFEKKYWSFLEVLRHANKEQRRVLLRSADKKLIKYICECALNVLDGVVSLKKHQRVKLKKYKKVLRNLAKRTLRKTAWKVKKRIIVQKGGSFLPYLIPPVLDFLINTFQNG